MSFYTTLCLPDRVEIITDGASWDIDGIVRRFSQKIDAVPGFPAAITTRGHVATAELIKDSVAGIFARAGSYDAAMAVLAQVVPSLEEHVRSANHIEIVVAGISESQGPITHIWGSRPPGEGLQAFTLIASRRGFVCGNEISAEQHAKVRAAGGLRARGVEFVDFFRRTADPSVNVVGMQGEGRVPIGGHVDLTTVRREGVTIERIHTYAEDRIGKRIDPFANDPKVTSILNRAERRRQAKLGRAVA